MDFPSTLGVFYCSICNNLVPDLMKQVDDKKMKFTVAVDLSYIKPKNQKYIAVAIDAQQSAPSGAQAQRMRELDQKGVLNGDVIDGIMLEEKKEETRVTPVTPLSQR